MVRSSGRPTSQPQPGAGRARSPTLLLPSHAVPPLPRPVSLDSHRGEGPAHSALSPVRFPASKPFKCKRQVQRARFGSWSDEAGKWLRVELVVEKALPEGTALYLGRRLRSLPERRAVAERAVQVQGTACAKAQGRVRAPRGTGRERAQPKRQGRRGLWRGCERAGCHAVDGAGCQGRLLALCVSGKGGGPRGRG